MKRYLQILLFVTTLLASGCSNDRSDDPVSEKTFKREWYQLVKTDTLTNNAMTQEIIGSTPSLGSTIIRNSFLYHSINGFDTLTLSGAVCWPLGMESCSEIWLESHYFSTCWDECPSQKAEPGMLISSKRNAIYIGADYQGLGLSRNLDLPYFNTVLLANQQIECFKAAMTILKDYGPDIPNDYYTYNVGFSLGGAVSMGAARQIELDSELREFIHLKKTFCGGGPYDQIAYFNHFLKDPGKELDFPIAFLCAIKSIFNSSPSFREKYDYSDCYSEKLMNSSVLQALDSKNHGSGHINNMLREAGCSSLQDILSAGMLDRDSQVHKDVLKETEKLDLTTGWTPRTPILVHHSRTDTYVPFACMESVISRLSDNPNVTVNINDAAQHNEDGTRFYIDLIFNLFPMD